MGVLNVSVESPYDPSVFAEADAAAGRVEELVDEGADIVDVGLATANKDVEVLSAAEERDRLDTACAAVERADADAVFSIETRYAEVAAAALEGPFEMVNDVCGFADPEMPHVCAERDVAVAKMASPPDLTRPGAVEETDWAARNSPEWDAEADYVDRVYAALEQNGFTDKTIVDPAFGGWSEAKTLADDRETFRRLREFRGYARPVLVSINRKSFLRKAVGRSTEAALPVSLGAHALAVVRGADVVRTHDVAETRDAALIADAFREERTRHDGPVGVVELGARTPGEVGRHLDRLDARADPAALAGGSVYELDGLDEPARSALADAAEHAGVAVATGAGGDTALVAGTPAAVRRLTEAVDPAGCAGLAAAFETIARDL